MRHRFEKEAGIRTRATPPGEADLCPPPHTVPSIQAADSVARMAVHQVGSIRSNGKNTLLAAENMETDAAAGEDAFNTQVAYC